MFEEPDFDDLEEVLKADREEYREQVSLEWLRLFGRLVKCGESRKM